MLSSTKGSYLVAVGELAGDRHPISIQLCRLVPKSKISINVQGEPWCVCERREKHRVSRNRGVGR